MERIITIGKMEYSDSLGKTFASYNLGFRFESLPRPCRGQVDNAYDSKKDQKRFYYTVSFPLPALTDYPKFDFDKTIS